MMQLMLLDAVTEYLAALDTLDFDVYDARVMAGVAKAEDRRERRLHCLPGRQC